MCVRPIRTAQIVAAVAWVAANQPTDDTRTAADGSIDSAAVYFIHSKNFPSSSSSSTCCYHCELGTLAIHLDRLVYHFACVSAAFEDSASGPETVTNPFMCIVAASGPYNNNNNGTMDSINSNCPPSSKQNAEPCHTKTKKRFEPSFCPSV